jgi:hypothetical protein
MYVRFWFSGTKKKSFYNKLLYSKRKYLPALSLEIHIRNQVHTAAVTG